VKRLDALIYASRRLGHGDLTARTGLTHWSDELGQVTKAFDVMAARLEQRESRAALAEEALRQSEEKYRNIFENAVEGIFQSTPEGYFLSANPAFARIVGYESPRELLAAVTDIRDHLYVDPEYRKRFRELIETNGFIKQYEAQLYRKDGAKLWVSLNARVVRDADGNTLYYEGIGNDITERKQAEEALAAAHRQVLDIIEFLPDATLVVDNQRKVIAWNKAMERMTGVRKEEMLGKGDHAYAVPVRGERRPLVIDLIFRNDEDITKYLESIRREGDSFFAEVHMPPGSPGAGSYLSVKASPLFDGDGNIIGAIESIRNLTDLKRAEKELRESEERYRTAIESSNDGIAILKNQKHLYVNKKYLQIFGFTSPEQVLDQPVGITVHKDDRERVVEINNKRRHRSGEAPDSYEFKGERTNGDVIFIEVSATETTYRGESVTLAYLRDITGRRSLESQLLQAQKMEAIGALAAGVAHDFNNILTTLMGYGNLLHMKMHPDDPLRVYVDHMLASTGKAASLTQSLLTFGRKQVMELKPHSVAALVKDALMLFRRLLPEDIELMIALGEDVTVLADMTQIGQVLMNLATNARDAMPKGGVLKIETTPTQIDKHFMRFHGYGEPGEYALISVTDTGTGMSGNTREKIFDPFFTTKEVGKGTGLGLSIVYGIVKQHGGYITVYSEDGIGTTFRVYLPAVKARATDAKPVPTDVPGGAETILFAEDNGDIRKMASDILGLLGYTVIEATDGADAVEKFRRHADKIDLLVFDVVMPVMNGKEAYQEIRAMKKDIKALFMSGYTNDVVFEKGILKDTVDYVSKPLTPRQLLSKVREVLDADKKQYQGLRANKEKS
jgi:PAS domain S-box-containing protein